MIDFYLSPTDKLVMVEGGKAWQWDATGKQWIRSDGLSASRP